MVSILLWLAGGLALAFIVLFVVRWISSMGAEIERDVREAEFGRMLGEGSRTSAEQRREISENLRNMGIDSVLDFVTAAAEEARAAAEEAREYGEVARRAAEEIRTASETGRVEAERDRVIGEERREDQERG